MLPQLVTVLKTRKTEEGLNLGMIGIILSLQIAFALHGFFLRDVTLLISNSIAAMVATTIIVVTRRIRRQQQPRRELPVTKWF